jgi:hypothetical protein
VDEFEKIFTALLSTPAGFVRMGNDLPTSMTSEPGDQNPRQSLHEELYDKIYAESGSLRIRSPLGDGEKLFSDLLDDLDNISQNHTDSARRRKKAREIFSDWLFSGEAGSGRNSPIPAQRNAERLASSSSAAAASSPGQHKVERRRKSHGDQPPAASRTDLYSKWRPRSFEYLSEVCLNPNTDEALVLFAPLVDCKFTCHHKCRPAVTLDCPRSQEGGDLDGASISSSSDKVASSRVDETSLVEESGSGRSRVRGGPRRFEMLMLTP